LILWFKNLKGNPVKVIIKLELDNCKEIAIPLNAHSKSANMSCCDAGHHGISRKI
jgi:hypothetical protein